MKISTNFSRTKSLFDERSFANNIETIDKEFNLDDFDKSIIKKAILQNDFFTFENIHSYFPILKSIDDLIENKNFLPALKIKINSTKENLENLSFYEKLEIFSDVLSFLENRIKQNYSEFEGSEIFSPKDIKQVFKDEYDFYISDEESERTKEQKDFGNHVDLLQKDWNAYEDNYGTSEEKYFVEEMNNLMDDLKSNFKEIYLLRNELFFKIYDFKTGQSFQPDFVLFMKSRNGEELNYQIFIEPKGEHLLKTDLWKENFLKEIEKKVKLEKLWENEKIKIIGLPFFNSKTKNVFESSLCNIF